MRLGAPVTKISRDDSKGKWLLDVRGSASEVFDKVVIATGMNQHPCIPTIKGIELFQGHCIHSRAFKRCVVNTYLFFFSRPASHDIHRPQDFEGKDVLVLGLGNTGADVAVSLVGHARQVYISHRHGTYIVSSLPLATSYPESRAIVRTAKINEKVHVVPAQA